MRCGPNGYVMCAPLESQQERECQSGLLSYLLRPPMVRFTSRRDAGDSTPHVTVFDNAVTARDDRSRRVRNSAAVRTRNRVNRTAGSFSMFSNTCRSEGVRFV